MKNTIMFFIGYIISFFIFYWIFGKLNIGRFIGDKVSRKIGLYLILIIIGFIGMSIIDNFDSLLEYNRIFKVVCMGPAIALTPFALPNNKIKK